jgi:hypothetical protein
VFDSHSLDEAPSVMASIDAAIDSWMTTIDQGLSATATGNTDTHRLSKTPPDWPRAYLRVANDDPAAFTVAMIVTALRAGDAMATSGAFVRTRAEQRVPHDPGADHALPLPSIALTNPIFVDVDRDQRWTPPGPHTGPRVPLSLAVSYPATVPRLSVIALCCAAWCLSTAANAQAQSPSPPQMRLGWVRAQGAERCPNSTTVGHAVEARIGRSVFSQDAPQSVEAIIQRTAPAALGPAAPRWSVSIFLRDVDGTLLGTRTLTSDRPDCEGAAAAAILAIALAIDPEAALHPEQTPVENTATQSSPLLESDVLSRITLAAIARFTESAARPPEPPVAARAGAPTVAPVIVAPRPQWTLGTVALGAWVSWGLVPQLGAGPALEAYARLYHRVGVRGAMRWLPEQRRDTPQFGDLSFGLLGAQLALDVELVATEHAALSLYSGPMLNAIHAIVHDRPPADAGERFSMGLSLGAHGAMQLIGPLEVSGAIELAVPIVRYRYLLDGPVAATIFEQPWISTGAFAALGARFR